MGIMFLS